MTDADHALAEKMVTCWTDFMKHGNPNSTGTNDWKPWTEEHPYVKTFA